MNTKEENMKKHEVVGSLCLMVMAALGITGSGCEGGFVPGEEGPLGTRDACLEVYRPEVVIRSAWTYDPPNGQGINLYVKAGSFLKGRLRIWISGKEVEGFVINPQTKANFLNAGEEGRIAMATFWNGGVIPRNTFKKGQYLAVVISKWTCVQWEGVDSGDGYGVTHGSTRCVREDWREITEGDRIFVVLEGGTLPELQYARGRTISLRSTVNHKFVRAGVESSCRLDAVSDSVFTPGWESFELIELGQKYVMLRSTQSKKFVHAEADGLLGACSDGRWDGPHFDNVFELNKLADGNVSLRSMYQGKFVRAGHGPGMIASSGMVYSPGWESFILSYHE